jgi:hypothetical protein
MAHVNILGMTESGKTTLAKNLAKKYAANGIRILVYDPLSDPDWIADFKTHDIDLFLEEYWTSRQCAVFIDEAGELSLSHSNEILKTATRGRHWGHKNHYISQRGALLPRTLRDQCSSLFMFAQSLDDAKLYAAEYNSPELKTANSLKKGEYFYTTRFEAITRGKLF